MSEKKITLGSEGKYNDDKFEFNYQRYQDKNYGFMNNKIGSTNKENAKSDPEPFHRDEPPRQEEQPYKSKFGSEMLAQSLRSNEFQNLRERSTSKEERDPQYDYGNRGIADSANTGHTSFRQRIEGLLPDRLKTQYQVQQKMTLQNGPLEEIHEESNGQT